MATFTRVTTAEEDAAVQTACTDFNARNGTSLTAKQFAMAVLDRWIAARVADYRESMSVSKGDAYNKMTPEDRAIVDPVFAKYTVTP
jgi:hypothetical protein